jgi:hypothetical protein
VRELERNKRRIYYALFDQNEPILDDDGNDTGEERPLYFAPVELRINVSPALGESATRQFGEVVDYDRTLVICDMSLPINEKTVFWIDETDTEKPYDYTVKKVAKSLNSLQIAVKKVEVSVGA